MKTLMQLLRPAFVLFVLLSLITGIVYPVAVTGIAQGLFPREAAGSLIVKDGKPVGSALIGQNFTEPKYFWGRPSATGPYAYNAAASSGSNQGPLNPALVDAVKGRIEALKAADPENTLPIPADLVTASGSGLDPHLSPAAARYRATAGHPETRRGTGRARPRSRPRPHRCHLRCTHRRRHRPRSVVRACGQRRPQRRHARPRNDLARPHRQPRRVPRQPVATAVLDTPRHDAEKDRRLRRRQHRPDAAPGGAHRCSAGPDHRRPRRDPPSAHRARPTPPRGTHRQHARPVVAARHRAVGPDTARRRDEPTRSRPPRGPRRRDGAHR